MLDKETVQIGEKWPQLVGNKSALFSLTSCYLPWKTIQERTNLIKIPFTFHKKIHGNWQK